MASDDTKFSSQSLDRRSFNDTFGMYEHIMYGDNGSGGVSALPSDIATEATLALIKDTDGIKKITDPVTIKSQYFFYASTDDATYDYVVKEDKDANWYVMRINKTTGTAEYATSAIQAPALSPDTAATALTNVATIDYTTPGGAF